MQMKNTPHTALTDLMIYLVKHNTGKQSSKFSVVALMLHKFADKLIKKRASLNINLVIRSGSHRYKLYVCNVVICRVVDQTVDLDQQPTSHLECISNESVRDVETGVWL